MAEAKFGDYVVEHEIGRGGMGVVYKAREAVLQRTVALKILAARLSGDPDYVARFLREARAAAQLDHFCIARVYAVGECNGRHYIAMEYVHGRTLTEWIRAHGPLPVSDALKAAYQITEALAAAHASGIVHRDIKPANIMVGEGGRIRVMDFGLAKMQGATTEITEAGAALGTPAYMSPEQVQGEAVDARTDIFSLGVTLFEMLTGRPPFHADTPLAMMYQIVHEPIGKLPERNPLVPQAVATLVERMTAKNPDERYASCQEVGRDLAALLHVGGEALSSPGHASAQAIAPRVAAQDKGGIVQRLRTRWGGMSKGARRIAVVAGTLLACVLVSVIVARWGLGVRSMVVAGTIMEPGLLAGDRVLVRRASTYDRGDVIVLDGLPGAKGLQVRRIVGKAGDTLEVRNSRLYLNGALVPETYIKEPMTYEVVPMQVKAGEILVLPDNRNPEGLQVWSSGTPLRQIRGKVTYIYAPGSRRGAVKSARHAFTPDVPKIPLTITADQMPFRVGAKWVFRVRSNNPKTNGKDYTRSIVSSFERDGKTFFRQRAAYPGMAVDDSALFVREEHAVVVYADGGSPQPTMTFRFPLSVGVTWEESEAMGTNAQARTARVRYTVEAQESVVVPAGTFECVRVRSASLDSSVSKNDVIEWIAPDVGEVKLVAGGSDIELVSFENNAAAVTGSAAETDSHPPGWTEVNGLLDQLQLAYGKRDIQILKDATSEDFLGIVTVPGAKEAPRVLTKSAITTLLGRMFSAPGGPLYHVFTNRNTWVAGGGALLRVTTVDKGPGGIERSEDEWRMALNEDGTWRMLLAVPHFFRSCVFVKEVVSGSQAEKLGIEAGDVVTEYAGSGYIAASDLVAAIRKHENDPPGTRISLKVKRADQETANDSARRRPRARRGDWMKRGEQEIALEVAPGTVGIALQSRYLPEPGAQLLEPEDAHSVKERNLEFEAASARKDIDACLALCHPDGALHSGAMVAGPARLREGLTRTFADLDGRYQLETLKSHEVRAIVSGDLALVSSRQTLATRDGKEDKFTCLHLFVRKEGTWYITADFWQDADIGLDPAWK